MAIKTNFYTKKTGSYLHAVLRIYDIVKLINELLFFTFSYILTSKIRKLQKPALSSGLYGGTPDAEINDFGINRSPSKF